MHLRALHVVKVGRSKRAQHAWTLNTFGWQKALSLVSFSLCFFMPIRIGLCRCEAEDSAN